MSFKNISGNRVASKNFKANATNTPTPWVRNPAWTALPSISSSDNKMVGLHAVYPEGGNYVALLARGAYNVNWGDGSSENVADNTTVYHEYDYADADLDNSNAPVTLTDSGDVVGRTAHGYTNGMKVRFFNLVSTTGIVETQTYYVINATADTFQVSATLGGSALALTTNGSATLLPYKQAVVTLTMQSGQTFTVCNLHKLHNKAGLNAYTSGWLDIAIAGSSLTSVLVATNTASNNTTGILFNFGNLERFNLLSSAVTDAGVMLYNCYSLQQIDNFVISTTNNASLWNTFLGCYSLQAAPYINTIKVTTVAGAFANCYSLTSVPAYNLSSCTAFNALFVGCRALQTVPMMDTHLGTDFNAMFQNCFNLKRAPDYNTISGMYFQFAFQNCYSLEVGPNWNLSLASNLSGMFQSCYSLTEIPLYSLSTSVSYIDMGNFLDGCYNLKELPFLNMAKAGFAQYAFRNCSSLKTIPSLLFSYASGCYCNDLFNGCRSLVSVPDMDLRKVGLSAAFANCTSLKSVGALNVTGNGTLTSMFAGCTALEVAPLLDTSSATAFNNVFANCNALQSVPLYDLHAATNVSSLFSACTTLQYVPKLDISAATNLTSMFNGCTSLASIPQLVSSASTTNTTMFTGCVSLGKGTMTGTKATISYASLKLGKAALEDIFLNLGLGTSQTITVSGNYGAVTPVALSGTTAIGSTTITMASTTGIVAGDFVTGSGTGITSGCSVTFNDAGDYVSGITSLGFVNGDPVSFSSITSTTGISVNVVYYVVNISGDQCQLAATVGGSVLPLTTNGSGNIKWGAKVVSIVTNTSVTLDRAAAVNTSATLSFRALDLRYALLRNWTVTGG